MNMIIFGMIGVFLLGYLIGSLARVSTHYSWYRKGLETGAKGAMDQMSLAFASVQPNDSGLDDSTTDSKTTMGFNLTPTTDKQEDN